MSDPPADPVSGGTLEDDLAALRAAHDTTQQMWKAGVLVEIESVHCEIERLADRKSGPARCAETALRGAIASVVAARRGGPVRKLSRYYSGAPIERAWGSIHRAVENLIVVGSDPWIKAYLYVVEAALHEHVSPTDPRYQHFKREIERLRQKSAFEQEDREIVAVISRTTHVASDIRQRNIRSFRNAVLLSALLLIGVLTVVALWHAVDPSVLSLCGEAESGGAICIGGASPRSTDLALIEIVGALGGLFAAIVPLVRTRRIRGPYELAGPQALLKAASGATTAILGLLLLEGGLFVGWEVKSGGALLAYAAFFGIAQQAVTQLVDRKLVELSDANPSGQTTAPP